MAASRRSVVAFFETTMVEDQIVVPDPKQGFLGEVYGTARVLCETYDATGEAMTLRGLPGTIARLRKTVAAS